MSPSPPLVSIVIPVFNGAALIEDLHRALAPALDSLEAESEVVFVDDGSRDETLAALRRVQRRDARVRIVELAANFGQHAAFAAGFECARGQYLVTMDADLQCDPRDLPRLIAPLGEGYDMVSGVRTARKDPPIRRLFSRIVTRLVASMAGVRLRDVGCPFNALTADVARSLSAFGELRRFLKPLAVRVARRVAEVEVAHRSRPVQRPTSSYSATRLLRLFMDFFVNSLGDVFAWIFAAGVGIAALAIVTATLSIAVALAGAAPLWPALLAVGVALAAATVALVGLAGDYVQRIYRQSTGRPFYLVRRVYEAEPGFAALAKGGPDGG